MPEQPIPRIRAPGLASFRRLERAHQPVVIEGAIDDWPALGAWTPDYLVRAHGDARVSLRVSPLDVPQLYCGDPLASFTRESARLAEFIAEACSNRPTRRAYLQYADLARELPRLQRDVKQPLYLPRWFLSPAFVWMCGSGTVNPLHYDYNHVLMAQVTGKKSFVLFSPQENRRLSRWFSRVVWRTTPIDVARPDRFEFPAYDRAQAHVCTLGPGDLLLIPYRFWHYARVEEFSVSVSWWWEPGAWTKLRDALVSESLRPFRNAVRHFRRRSEVPALAVPGKGDR